MAGYLLDTNVVLRLFDRDAPEYADCRGAVERLQQNGHVLILAPQVIYEFWVVSTRPPDQRKGFGWTVDRAKEAIDHLLDAFEIYPDKPEVFDKWRELVERYEIKGKRAHDARLAAYQEAHEITNIVTLNDKDFRGISENVFTPGEISAAS